MEGSQSAAYSAIQLQHSMARKLQEAILPARPAARTVVFLYFVLLATFCFRQSCVGPWLLIAGRYSFFLCAFFAGALAKTIGSEVIKRFRAKTAGDH